MQINKDLIKSTYINRISHHWTITPNQFPVFLNEISTEQKNVNEEFIDTVFKDFTSHFQSISKGTFLRRRKWRKKTLTMVHGILNSEDIIGIHTILRENDLEKMQQEIGEFLYKAREFDKDLTVTDIGQAVRNYIVYMMFKELNHIDRNFSQACFGYSMLYPFTDNYIDNINLSTKEKTLYNNIIRDKIIGKDVKTQSMHQSKTCMLLDFIESEYARSSDTSIYTLLLMMLEAQEISMTKQKENQLSEQERLHISIYKGGLSVLIDRYLINKPLTEEDMIFYLSFGFFLQLADDLLDIAEDIKAGSNTIFTSDTSSHYLESLINKLITYVNHLFGSYHAMNHDFKDFVLKNCYFLILYGVSENKELLTPAYFHQLEKYFPLHFSYLATIRDRSNQINASITQANYNMLLEEILINYKNPTIRK